MLFNKLHVTILFIVIIALFAIGFNYFYERCSKTDYATCRVDIEGYKLKLKVAHSRQAQAKGLMGINELEDNTGMIFVYDQPQYLSFWMKNTLIPLSIAFVESSGRISGIYGMEPHPELKETELPVYISHSMVKYAIEVPFGWFSIRGIKKGMYINIPEELR